MFGDLYETAVKRSVYLWCLLIAYFSRQTWPLAATMLAVIGTLGMNSTRITITTPPERYLRDTIVLYTMIAAGVLTLYGFSRLLFRGWQPLVACMAFLVAQAVHQALRLAAKLQMNSKILFDIFGLFGKMTGKVTAKVSYILVENPPSRHALVRYPLLAIAIVLFLAGNCALTVLGTFSNFSVEALPPIRAMARELRLQFRSWSNGFLAILASKPSQYTHTSLKTPDKSIRLLKLLPRRPLGQIHCELFEVAISDAPEYEAVSYTWGPADFTGLIHIQGKPLTVSRSIETLFYHLSSYTETKVLWIDQLCINQADDTEKSSQVPLMGAIYSNAANTIVWLNDVEEPWKARTMLSGIWHELVYGTEESSLAMMRQYSSNFPHTGGWAHLMNIFAHPFFTRIWVVQETILSPCITVLASGQPIDWDHLALFASKMHSSPYSEERRTDPGIGLKDTAPGGFGQACFIATLRDQAMDGLDFRTRGPEFLLGMFSDLRSTLAVDRLYGLSSLFPPEPGSPRQWLTPDYSKSAQQVYAEAAQGLLLEPRDNHNEILSFAGAGWRQNILGLPSWAPDWSSHAMPDTFHRNFTKIQGSSHFNASAGTSLAMWFSTPIDGDGPLLLSVLGHPFDAIAHLGPLHLYTEHNRGLGPAEDDAIVAVLKAHFSSRRLAMQYASDPYGGYRPTNQRLHEAFWRTLVGDTVLSRPAQDDLGRGCRLWERIMVSAVDPAGEDVDLVDETNEMPSMNEIKAMKQEREALREALLWNSARSNCCTGRRFCVTGRGYLAMVPPGTEEGDELVILYGFRTPFVLRRVPGEGSGRSVLVGEAYVHGVMDGEAMMEEGKSPEVFELI